MERKAKRQAEIEPDKKYIEYSEKTAKLSAKIRKIALLFPEYKVILGFGGASLCFLFFLFLPSVSIRSGISERRLRGYNVYLETICCVNILGVFI